MHILAVGIATLDIINHVAVYPREDDEVRALRQSVRRGGNATNTLVVLSQLGHDCHWAGSLAEETDSRLILEDLAKYHIDCRHVRRYSEGKVPTSYVLLSEATGSRTIVHHRDLPEYEAADFLSIDTHAYDWIHFEGRNVSETRKMLQYLQKINATCPISLEVEKAREEIDSLFPYPDVLMFSQAFAQSKGCQHPIELFTMVRPSNPKALLFCTWGVQGAWTQTPAGEVLHVPAEKRVVVDTLAAGDVFNAGVIHALLCRYDVSQALQQAVRLAGDKCAQQGLDGLVRGDG
jgi:ketohexokinase